MACTVDKGSCAWSIRRSELLPQLACRACKPLINLTRHKATKEEIPTKGVCLRLHGSSTDIQRLDARHNRLENALSRQLVARPSQETNRRELFVAGPANDTSLFSEQAARPQNRQRQQRRKRKRTDIKAVENADLNDPQFQRALLDKLTDGKGRAGRRGGHSASSRKRVAAAVGTAANNLVSMMAGDDVARQQDICSQLTTAAEKRVKQVTPTPQESATPDEISTRRAADLPLVCGQALRLQILQQQTVTDRRPFLAALADFKCPDVEKYLGLKINSTEWNKVRIHARFPGAFKPVPKVERFLCRVNPDILQQMLAFLDDPTNTQRLAYGRTVRAIMNNGESKTLDKVCLNQTKRATAAKFIVAIFGELEAIDNNAIATEDRCASVEEHTFRRCRRQCQHAGKCTFTTKGSISLSTATDLVASLSDDELKKLSGLDDTKQLQGRDNFIRMRRLVDSLFGTDEIEAKQRLKEMIDSSEVFHKCYFANHLKRNGTHHCSCLNCGFCDPKNPDDIKCGDQQHHLPSCVDCATAFAVLEELETKFAVRQQEQPTEASLEELQLLSESAFDIQCCYEDLREYRSHLARHEAEKDFAATELSNLKDDEAVVTSDFKMKILATFFRENQKKWFGKRGITGLGFMIVYNDVEDRSKKVVKFFLMLTDDTKQDAWEVICAKSHIYQHELPKHVKRSRFRSDGAGCYKGQINRALQPFWFVWTGIIEISNSIEPAGGGKSALDGTFGRFGVVLTSLVNSGCDIATAADILVHFGESGGVKGLTLLLFEPDRTKQLKCELSVSLESVLRTELDPQTGTLLAYKHAGYGSGYSIEPTDASFTVDESDPIEFFDDLIPSVLAYAGVAEDRAPDVVLEALSPLSFVPNSTAHCFRPRCSLIEYGSNKKQDVAGAGLSRPGEGLQTDVNRQARRVGRVEERCAKKANSVEAIRQQKENAGVFCCEFQCPITHRYCTSEFLTRDGRDKHVSNGERCVFLTGVSARDRLILAASKPGGILAVGTRPNRLEGNRIVTASSIASPGEEAARCYQRFNRKEGVAPYIKPEKLVSVLEDLFKRVPKLDEYAIRDEMSKMRDADGSLTFCWQKRGDRGPPKSKKAAWRDWQGCQQCGRKPCACNGMLLSVEQIKQWITQRAQKKKKNNNH